MGSRVFRGSGFRVFVRLGFRIWGLKCLGMAVEVVAGSYGTRSPTVRTSSLVSRQDTHTSLVAQ